MSRELTYTVGSQGHWWIEFVTIGRRRPGFIEFYIQTEQKRPANYGGTISGDTASIFIGSQGESSLGFRDGEDGSEATWIDIQLPKTLPGRTWEFIFSEDKWGIRGAAWTRKIKKWEKNV